jgi:hypothetical protein
MKLPVTRERLLNRSKNDLADTVLRQRTDLEHFARVVLERDGGSCLCVDCKRARAALGGTE